ncbi:hypothetical protein Tco_1445993 [Tanacetum coccineum]
MSSHPLALDGDGKHGGSFASRSMLEHTGLLLIKNITAIACGHGNPDIYHILQVHVLNPSSTLKASQPFLTSYSSPSAGITFQNLQYKN